MSNRADFADLLSATGELPFAVDYAILPPMAKRLIAIMGERMALRLMKRRGGTQIKVPLGTAKPRALATDVQLSADAIIALSESDLAGTIIDVPKVDKILNLYRNQAIRIDRDNGMSQPKLARKYDLSVRWVRVIIQAGEEEETQKNLDLF